MEDSSKYIVSAGTYEGGLLGLSFTSFDQVEALTTEYAFSATEGPSMPWQAATACWP